MNIRKRGSQRPWFSTCVAILAVIGRSAAGQERQRTFLGVVRQDGTFIPIAIYDGQEWWNRWPWAGEGDDEIEALSLPAGVEEIPMCGSLLKKECACHTSGHFRESLAGCRKGRADDGLTGAENGRYANRETALMFPIDLDRRAFAIYTHPRDEPNYIPRRPRISSPARFQDLHRTQCLRRADSRSACEREGDES